MLGKRKCVRLVSMTCIGISVAFLLFWAAGQYRDVWVELGSGFVALQARDSVVFGVGNTLGIREGSIVPIDAPVRLRAEPREVHINDTYLEGFQAQAFLPPPTMRPDESRVRDAQGYVVGFPNWFGALLFSLWPAAVLIRSRLGRSVTDRCEADPAG